MFSFTGFHGVFRRFLHLSAIKSIHFLPNFRPNKPIKQYGRNWKKPIKSSEKKTKKKEDDVDPKVYTRDTIANIYRALKYSTWESAQQQLESLRIRWDSFTVNQVLKTHPPMEKAWLFFNWASRLRGFKHDQFTYTTMLDIFGEAGRVSSMSYVFQQMEEKGIKSDAVTYTSVMHWLSKAGDIDGAVKVWEEMRANGCNPTVVSYTAYMKVLFDGNRVKEGTDVYKEMLRSGCSPNCHTYTVLMEYLVGCGKYKEALDIFGKMQEAGVQPDKAACNILVEKCCKAEATWAMTHILLYMKENRLVLRYPVFLKALEILKYAGESDILLRQVNPHIPFEYTGKEDEGNESGSIATGTIVPSPVDRGLVLMLLEKQNLVAVDYMLDAMINKNIHLDSVIISTVIEVNCDHGRPDGALLALEYSVKIGIKVGRTAYLALIGILIRSNSFPKIVEIVDEMIKAGHSLGTYIAALLIYRLGCARRPLCAVKIFNKLPDEQKNTATYTALIGVYFSAGSAEKGLEIYQTMLSKQIHPALGTYNVIIAGLEKSRVCDAEIYRKRMKSLQTDGHSRDTVPMEEKICDLLFAEDVVS